MKSANTPNSRVQGLHRSFVVFVCALAILAPGPKPLRAADLLKDIDKGIEKAKEAKLTLPPPDTQIQSLQIKVKTKAAGKKGAFQKGSSKKEGTDNPVWFDIGSLGWKLNKSGDDFQAGAEDTYDLPLPAGATVTVRDIVCLRLQLKGQDGVLGRASDAWEADSFHFIVNGKDCGLVPLQKKFEGKDSLWIMGPFNMDPDEQAARTLHFTTPWVNGGKQQGPADLRGAGGLENIPNALKDGGVYVRNLFDDDKKYFSNDFMRWPGALKIATVVGIVTNVTGDNASIEVERFRLEGLNEFAFKAPSVKVVNDNWTFPPLPEGRSQEMNGPRYLLVNIGKGKGAAVQANQRIMATGLLGRCTFDEGFYALEPLEACVVSPVAPGTLAGTYQNADNSTKFTIDAAGTVTGDAKLGDASGPITGYVGPSGQCAGFLSKGGGMATHYWTGQLSPDGSKIDVVVHNMNSGNGSMNPMTGTSIASVIPGGAPFVQTKKHTVALTKP